MITIFLAFLAVAMPIKAEDEDKAEPPPEEDTILGTWYIQVMEGEVTALDEQVRVVFDEDGGMRVMEGGEESEVARYTHDKERSRISLYEARNPADIEAVIRYSFVDDMLVMRIVEDPGPGGEGDEAVYELTRDPEGTERHRAMRDRQGDGPTRRQRVQSMNRMRGLFQGAITQATAQKERMPASIGELVTGDFVTPGSVLAPWSEHEVPEGFNEWADQKQAEWANTHTGYVYLAAGRKFGVDTKRVVLLELPVGDEPESVGLCFEDGRTEIKAYDEADKLIKQQTGHTIAQWRKTTSPGTGEMVLPKQGDDHDDHNEHEAVDRDKP